FGLLSSSAALADSAPHTKLPGMTAEQLTIETIRPSMVWLNMTETGTVVVPYTNGTHDTWPITEKDGVGKSCSGSIINGGLNGKVYVLSAAHCVLPDNTSLDLIDYIYQLYVNKGWIDPNKFTPDDAYQNWKVPDQNMDTRAFLLSSASTLGTADVVQ